MPNAQQRRMNPYKYRISIRVRDKNSDLRDLYGSLQGVPGIVLRRLNERNTPRTDIKGNPLPGIYPESSFGFAFRENAESSENVSFESSIEKILDALQPFLDQLRI
jgi:hypothetical protein